MLRKVIFTYTGNAKIIDGHNSSFQYFAFSKKICTNVHVGGLPTWSSLRKKLIIYRNKTRSGQTNLLIKKNRFIDTLFEISLVHYVSYD